MTERRPAHRGKLQKNELVTDSPKALQTGTPAENNAERLHKKSKAVGKLGTNPSVEYEYETIGIGHSNPEEPTLG